MPVTPLSEQDVILANHVITAKQEFGQSNHFDYDKIKNKVEFIGPDTISYKKLKQSIAIRTLEKLGSNWDIHYGCLQAYKDKHGHLILPQTYKSVGNITLSFWTQRQRTLYNKNKLSQDRIDKLNQLGFVWDLLEYKWLENYEEAVKFYKTHSTWSIPNSQENLPISNWIRRQRIHYQNRTLSKEHINLLEKHNFIWNPFEQSWMSYYNKLLDFYNTYHHVNVTKEYDDSLVNWLGAQKIRYMQNKISKKEINMLKKLKVDLVIKNKDDIWNRKYEELKAYKSHYGHCHVPRNYANGNLASWVTIQRNHLTNNKLRVDRKQKLDKLGFIWDGTEHIWNEQYNKLKLFYKNNKHCNVPHDYPDSYFDHWIRTQRQNFKLKKSVLTLERINKLKKLNFNFELKNINTIEKNENKYIKSLPEKFIKQINNKFIPTNIFEKQWLINFYQFADYCFKNHTNEVPYKINKTLSNWMSKQRRLFLEAKLSQQAINCLDLLGFDFEPNKFKINSIKPIFTPVTTDRKDITNKNGLKIKITEEMEDCVAA